MCATSSSLLRATISIVLLIHRFTCAINVWHDMLAQPVRLSTFYRVASFGWILLFLFCGLLRGASFLWIAYGASFQNLLSRASSEDWAHAWNKTKAMEEIIGGYSYYARLEIQVEDVNKHVKIKHCLGLGLHLDLFSKLVSCALTLREREVIVSPKFGSWAQAEYYIQRVERSLLMPANSAQNNSCKPIYGGA